MDENEFEDLGSEDINNDRNKNRFNKLTEKVGQEAKAREAAETKAAEEAAGRLAAEKERDFYASFSDSTSQYPEAAAHKDAIKEKVMAGYSVEDATVAILAKEGKLQNYTPPAPRMESPAGGSATTAMRNDFDKSPNEMSRDEKRAELLRIEQEGGGLSNMLRRNA
jgi:hypothetical protein